MTTSDLLISPQLIDQFNHAAGLAREGRFEDSLVAWNRLLEPTDADKLEERVLTGDFLGQCYLRKAWVLMDLNLHAQARAVLEDPVLEACLGQFSTENLYEYFFSYANTLGNLGAIEPMDEAFSKALHIAADELGDYTRCYHCWSNLLAWGEQAGAWDYLLREIPMAEGLARNVGDGVLENIALLYKAMALAHTGGKDAARSIVEPLRKYARGNELGNVIERCDEILRVIES